MLKRSVAVSFASILLLSLLSSISVHAAQPNIRWDDGTAEIDAPPFLLSFDLPDYSEISEIRRGKPVNLDIEVETESDVCEWNLTITPTLNGVPTGSSTVLVGQGSYDFDEGSVRFTADSAGLYALRLEGLVRTPSPQCSLSNSVVSPYSASIELFDFKVAPPSPASAEKVGIVSSGPNTLVASTRGRSRAIGITFAITDPKKRNDLLYSICMRDTDDCWIEDAKLVPGSATKRTQKGWNRTWNFWWARSSPSSCVSYYWNQPDVGVLLIISNADGKVIGRKKHGVKLTCRL